MYDLTVIYFGNQNAVGRAQMMISALPAKTNLVTKSTSAGIISFGFRIFLALFRSRRILILNRKSALIFLLYYPLFCLLSRTDRLHVIYDMWEFYTLKEQKKLTSRLGTIVEIFTLRRVNQVVVCNDYRKKLVQRYYGVKTVHTIENVRALSPVKTSKISLKRQYLGDINWSAVNFVITNGFSRERGDIHLVDSFAKLDNCSLTFIGNPTAADQIFLAELLSKKKINNVNTVSAIPYADLAGVVGLFDFGVVNYSFKNLNNKYCASGKVYEFMFLDLPVLTSKNPSLKKLIDRYRCGESSDEFDVGIMRLINNHAQYKKALDNTDKTRLLTFHKEHIFNVISRGASK